MTGRPPVVIIGMHRSGTSLLTRVLQEQGFFMGAGARRNEEAAFTNAVNAWLFREASATWDRPEPVDDLLADTELRSYLVDYMQGIVRGPAAARFLGPRRATRALRGGMPGLDEPWGWKDPRTTWTLPLWREVFPQLRVLHIVRHGVDVAASLRSRRERVFRARTARYQRRRALYRNHPLAPKRRGFGPQVRCATLEGGLELWEHYVARARKHVAELDPQGRALELRYEDLLGAPADTLNRALAFCDCPADPERLHDTVRGVDPNRAHAWQQDEELRAFATRHAQRLARLGYDAGP